MLRRGVSRWRQVRTILEDGGSGISRKYSEATSSGAVKQPSSSVRPNPFGEEASNSRLFDKAKAKPLPESETGDGAAAGEATAAAGKILRRVWNSVFAGALTASVYFGYYTVRYSNEQIEDMIDETEKPENQFPGSGIWVSVMSWYADQRTSIEKEWTKYAEPPSEQLLPEQHPHTRQAGVQTLVMDLDDLLIHSHWTRGRGWRTFKRPGVDDFLKHMSQMYELVLYTHQSSMYAEPILQRLDPEHLIQFRLFRESTRYVDGIHMRDLSKLNRDLGKVLILTTEPETAGLQKQNAVTLKKWKLETEDTTLLDLIPFLEALAAARTNLDVRDVIASYEGEDIPNAFKARMKQAAEARSQQRQRGSFFGGFGNR